MFPCELGLMCLPSCVYSDLPSACTRITLLSPVPPDAPACTRSAAQVFLLGVMSCPWAIEFISADYRGSRDQIPDFWRVRVRWNESLLKHSTTAPWLVPLASWIPRWSPRHSFSQAWNCLFSQKGWEEMQLVQRSHRHFKIMCKSIYLYSCFSNDAINMLNT